VRQATGSPAAALPADLTSAVRAEFWRALHPPFEIPLIVAANGSALTGAWFLAPPRLAQLLFTFHGPLAFPMALAGWMYSDVPATNQLGADPGWALAALPDRTALRRLYRAKHLALWLLVSPLALTVAVIVGLREGHPLASVFTLLWIGVVPLGALGLSTWLGIYLPYHPVPLRRRWEHRRPYRRQLRWLLLVVAPYVLVPLAVLALSVPTIVLWITTVGLHRQHVERFTDRVFDWGVGLGVALALVAWLGGVRAGAFLAQRRADRLAPFLADPDRG
jgi:hypothetical protein